MALLERGGSGPLLNNGRLIAGGAEIFTRRVTALSTAVKQLHPDPTGVGTSMAGQNPLEIVVCKDDVDRHCSRRCFLHVDEGRKACERSHLLGCRRNDTPLDHVRPLTNTQLQAHTEPLKK